MVKEDSREAFEVLYDRHKNQIHSYLVALVKSPEWAMELTQESFLRAYEKRALYKKGHTFTSWLYSISRNLSIDELKRKDATRFTVELKDAEGEILPAAELPSSERGPFENTLKNRESEKLKASLSKLPDQYKDVLLLRVFSEMSYDEIAKELGIKVSSVKTHLNRAKKKLMEIMKED